jgi:SP family myo-inositol transporter-like MFS transporter 13
MARGNHCRCWGPSFWLVPLVKNDIKSTGSANSITGYDTGIISAVLVYLNDDLGVTLSSGEKELITSITSGGAFIGAIAAGLTADRFGRKGAIYMGCALFIIGAVLQAASYSLAQMTVGRLVVGLGKI